MRKIFVIVLLLLALILFAACGGSGEAEVTGNIILPDGATVPEGATVNVQIQDTSLADAAATTIGEQRIEGSGQSGDIPFAVSYDSSQIEDNHEYTMSVRIEDADGSLLFISDTAIPVISRGGPTTGVEVPVISVN